MTTQPTRSRFSGSDLATIGGGVAMAVGPFLPYINAASGFGNISRSGVEMIAGEIFIVVGAGVLVAYLAWSRVQRDAPGSRVPTVLALVGGALTAWYFMQINGRINDLAGNEFVAGSVGLGLWLTAAGALVALVASWMVYTATRRPADAAPEASNPPAG